MMKCVPVYIFILLLAACSKNGSDNPVVPGTKKVKQINVIESQGGTPYRTSGYVLSDSGSANIVSFNLHDTVYLTTDFFYTNEERTYYLDPGTGNIVKIKSRNVGVGDWRLITTYPYEANLDYTHIGDNHLRIVSGTTTYNTNFIGIDIPTGAKVYTTFGPGTIAGEIISLVDNDGKLLGTQEERIANNVEQYFRDNIAGYQYGINNHCSYTYAANKRCVGYQIENGYYQSVPTSDPFTVDYIFRATAIRKMTFDYSAEFDQLNGVFGNLFFFQRTPWLKIAQKLVHPLRPYDTEDLCRDIASKSTDSLFKVNNGAKQLISATIYTSTFKKDVGGNITAIMRTNNSNNLTVQHLITYY